MYFVKRGWKKSVSENIGGWGWGYGHDEGDDLAVEWLLDLATVDQTILESSDIPITHAGSIHDDSMREVSVFHTLLDLAYVGVAQTM